MDASQDDGEHRRQPRPTIRRISARASLDDPEPELDRARRAADEGDSSWRQWLHEYRRGEALVTRLDVRVEVEDAEGALDAVEMHNRGIWLELRADPPLVEAQVAELADKDFRALERRLLEGGVDLPAEGLNAMYVHVELAGDLRSALSGAPAACELSAGTPSPASRVGDTPP